MCIINLSFLIYFRRNCKKKKKIINRFAHMMINILPAQFFPSHLLYSKYKEILIYSHNDNSLKIQNYHSMRT